MHIDVPEKTTSRLTIALAWLIVTIPMGWGVYQSVVKSLPLFRSSGAPKDPAPGAPKPVARHS